MRHVRWVKIDAKVTPNGLTKDETIYEGEGMVAAGISGPTIIFAFDGWHFYITGEEDLAEVEDAIKTARYDHARAQG